MMHKIDSTTIKNLLLKLVYLAIISLSWVLLHQYEPDLLNSITQGLRHHVIIFGLIRWGIILLTLTLWPYFVFLIKKRHGITIDTAIYWQSKRINVAMWLILFELLVCENIVGKFIYLVAR
jgi:hypothetical protein